jgi:hypothetical protein
LVKGVLIGLAVASVVTWTVWLAKTAEILVAQAASGVSAENPCAGAVHDREPGTARRKHG